MCSKVILDDLRLKEGYKVARLAVAQTLEISPIAHQGRDAFRAQDLLIENAINDIALFDWQGMPSSILSIIELPHSDALGLDPFMFLDRCQEHISEAFDPDMTAVYYLPHAGR